MAKKADKMEVISIIADADVLADQHEVFVEKFVTRANDELYLMLGNIMAICLQVEASAAKASIVKEMRNKLRDNFGLKTQSNSRVPSIVVRYIVRSNRKTAHIYGRVIEVAIANNITPEQLPDFIRDRGGIDEIRLSVVSAEEKKANDDKWANARYALSGLLCKREPIGKVVMNTNTRLLTASDVEFSYLICNKNLKTGEIDVLGAIYPSSDIETRALELFTITSLAMQHNGTNKFFEVCNENGLNQDILHSWMKLNGFSDDTTARDFTRTLIRSTNELNKEGEK
jgi:hypothetical protein